MDTTTFTPDFTDDETVILCAACDADITDRETDDPCFLTPDGLHDPILAHAASGAAVLIGG